VVVVVVVVVIVIVVVYCLLSTSSSGRVPGDDLYTGNHAKTNSIQTVLIPLHPFLLSLSLINTVMPDMHRLGVFKQSELWYNGNYTVDEFYQGWGNIMEVSHWEK